MKITKTFKIGTDTAQYVAYLKSNPGNRHNVPLKVGLYKITMGIKEDKKFHNYDFLEVKTDTFLVVTDAGDTPESWFNKNHIHKKGCYVSTGGDGHHNVIITIERVGKIDHHPHNDRLNKAKEFLKSRKYSEEVAKEFVDKFMHTYSNDLNELLQKERIKVMDKFVKEMDKYLKDAGIKKNE